MCHVSVFASVFLLLWGCSATVGGDEATFAGSSYKDDDPLDTDARVPPPEEAPACTSAEVDVQIEFLERPADIVWVIDSSGSMSNEAALVQEHMNDFADRFSSSDVDAQIIVVTPSSFVNVPPPLGTDEERFFQVSRSVSSSAALRALLDTYDSYGERLRPNAIVHFIAVTDDESSLRGECFVEEMQERLGPDRRFKLHTISSEAVEPDGEMADEEPTPEETVLTCAESDSREKRQSAQACSGAARPGLEYREAAQLTDGLAISICTPDWSAVFDQLAGSVEKVSILGCEFSMPEPPPGAVLLPDEVELLAKSEGVQSVLQRVAGEAACDDGDWYYDNPSAPASVLLCPSACDTLGAQGAQLALELGCAWSVR